jgi:putative membrane-bound dehydrogenase-like protein
MAWSRRLSHILVAAALASACRTPHRPPYEPKQALETFRLAPGFRVELAAAEPQIEGPVAMSFDARGRIFVAEMPDYPMGTRRGRIKLLEDRDGDGFFERSAVFADDIPFPNGVMAWKKGVLVTSAPDILYLGDNDGDGRADERRVVLTGFAALNPQIRANGLVYGIDNWIYGAYPKFGPPSRYVKEFGDLGTPLRFPDRPGSPPVDVFARGMDFRFRPDEGALEAVAGNSQFGNTFDAWGNRFTVWNNNHVRHVVLGARYAARNPQLAVESSMYSASDHGNAATVYPITRDPLYMHESEIGHFTSACGITLYQGGAFPQSHDGAFFVCEPVHNLVHCDRLQERGATFAARREREGVEFLASTDSWFRPVFTTVGPDGALWVVDFYRKIVEHPEWMPRDMMNEADMAAGHDRGRIYRITAATAGRTPQRALDRASTAELVEQLADANSWRRSTAQRLLVTERRDPAAAPLLERLLVPTSRPEARVHALWTLHGLGALAAPVLDGALDDPDARVREQAVLLAEERIGDPAVAAKLLSMAGHVSGRLEFQLACTLGFLTPERSFAALEQIAFRHVDDPWFQIAVLSAADVDAAAWHRAAIARARAGAGVEPFLRRIAELVGARMREPEIARLLAAVRRGDGSAAAARTSLEGLAAGLRRAREKRISPELQDSILALLDVRDLARPALEAASAVQLEPSPRLRSLLARATAEAADVRAAPERRAEAAGRLGLDPTGSTAAVLDTLLVPRQPEDVQLAAAGALLRLKDARASALLVERWKGSTGRVREAILTGLFARRDRLPAVLDGLEAGKIDTAGLSRPRKNQLVRFLRNDERKRPALLAALQEESRGPIVERYRPALRLDATPGRGAEVFAARCSKCHRIGEVGQEVGPDLASVASRTREDLLLQILDPNAYIVPGYEEYVIETTDGKLLQGLIARETASAVTLRRSGGESDTVLRSQIASLRSLAVSQMPEDLEQGMSLQQMADLLAYMKALAARPAS